MDYDTLPIKTPSVGIISFSITEPLKRLRSGRPVRKRFCSTLRLSDDDGHDEPTPQEEALSNYLVLQKIFSLLPTSDLRTCTKVNKTWESIASSLLCDIRIESRKCYLDSCKVTALISHGSSSTLHHKVSWSEILQYIEESSFKSIYMHVITGRVKMEHDFYSFLTNCGCLVSRLDLTNSQYLGIKSNSLFLKFMHENFPNLKYLTLKECFAFDDSLSVEDCERVQLRSLEVIDFGTGSKSGNFVRCVLMFAPNLEQSFNFPLEFIDILARAKRYKTVRSIEFPGKTSPKKIETLVAKFAALEPKLQSFDWKFISRYLSIPMIKASLNKVLQSSKDTLAFSIVARPWVEMECLEFPKMPALEHIRFEDSAMKSLPLGDAGTEDGAPRPPFFQAGTNLKEIFPNLKTVTLNMDLDTQESVPDYFPRGVFQPFGSGIKNLITKSVNPECIPELSLLFPFVTTLNIIWSRQMHSVLDQVYKSWNRLRVLTLTVDHFAAFSNRGRNHNFDAAVTGLSVETCNELRTNLKIMRENPGTLSNLQHLENLRIILTEKELSVRGKAQNFITSVTIDYLMCFLPYVKVFIGIQKNCQHVKDVMELLKPLLPYVECDTWCEP